MNIAVILAGGRGLRFSRDIPKQFVNLKEKPIIIHTIEKFENCALIDAICVVCIEEYKAYCAKLCAEYGIHKTKWIFSGGITRHFSIASGLRHLSELSEQDPASGIGLDSKIVLHNANYPLISPQLIAQCLQKLDEGFDIVSSVTRCNDYLYEISQDNEGLTIGPDRDKILFARVPESFKLKTGLSLYLSDDFADEQYCSYATGMLGILKGKNVGSVECASTNFKITNMADYELMKAFL